MKQTKLSKHTAALFLAVALGTIPLQQAVAQASSSDAAQPAVGTEAIVHAQALVVGIDAGTNTVTIKGPRGNVVDIAVDPAVANVSNLKVGDVLNIAYREALLMSLDKVATKGVRERKEESATLPASGGVVAAARKVEVIATVVNINAKARHVTLRGPQHTVTLDVSPDVSLSGIKKGDSVRAVFVSAAAVQVVPGGAGSQ
jgi:Cu/Ag efflux protein CusF